MFADFLDEEEEEERIQWKYSDYVKGLEREEQLLNGDDRASSILSCKSGEYVGCQGYA